MGLWKWPQLLKKPKLVQNIQVIKESLTLDISLAHMLAVLLDGLLHVIVRLHLDVGLAGRPALSRHGHVDAIL